MDLLFRIIQMSRAVWYKHTRSDRSYGLTESLPRKSVVKLTDCLHMTMDVDWDVKPQHNNNNNSHY